MMPVFRLLHGKPRRLLLLLIVLALPVRSSASPAPTLTVNESGAYLYAGQNENTERIARLEKGELLIPMAQVGGTQTWYMVKTPAGALGWVRSSDVTKSERTEELFEKPRLSAWQVRIDNLGDFYGTWTIEAGAASGTWTLLDESGKTLSSGRWSAEKFSTGWSGVWQVSIDGRADEYSGSWTADPRLSPRVRLADLFQAAVQDWIRGIWISGGYTGSWIIRAADAS